MSGLTLWLVLAGTALVIVATPYAILSTSRSTRACDRRWERHCFASLFLILAGCALVLVPVVVNFIRGVLLS